MRKAAWLIVAMVVVPYCFLITWPIWLLELADGSESVGYLKWFKKRVIAMLLGAVDL